MELNPLTLLAFGTLGLGLLLFILISNEIPKGFKQVTGPKGLPFIGNSLQLKKYPREQFVGWAAKYNELFKLQLGWHTWVFLNSREAVKEIMDRQSVSTSGRPHQPVASELISGGYRFLMMDYTPKWRKLRAMVHKLLTPKASNLFKPSQEFEAKQVLHDILTDNGSGGNFYMHVRRYATSVVMTSTYGRRIATWVCSIFLSFPP
jgi:cytochrome P450